MHLQVLPHHKTTAHARNGPYLAVLRDYKSNTIGMRHAVTHHGPMPRAVMVGINTTQRSSFCLGTGRKVNGSYVFPRADLDAKSANRQVRASEDKSIDTRHG